MKTIQPLDNYLFVKYTEPFELDEFLALIREVADVCRNKSRARVLVDVSEMSGKMSTMDRFRLGVEGAAIFRNLAQVAIVYRQQEMNRFAETVGINRGGRVRVFGDLDTAMKWLGV